MWELIFKNEKPEWKKWDAPYFPHQTKPLEAFLSEQEVWLASENCWIVEVDGQVRGTVSYYWEHELHPGWKWVLYYMKQNPGGRASAHEL